MAVTTGNESRQSASSSNGGPQGQLDSFDPATGELVGSVPTITPDQVQSVVDEVAHVQPLWAQLSLGDRGRYLRRAAQVLLDHSDEIAELISREQGKPRLESFTMELLPTIDLLHWCADNGQRILADWWLDAAPVFRRLMIRLADELRILSVRHLRLIH